MEKKKLSATTLVWLKSETASELQELIEGYEFSKECTLENDLWKMFTFAMGNEEFECHIQRGDVAHSFKTILKTTQIMCKMRLEQFGK